MKDTEKEEEEVSLEHGMFAVERQEDLVAIIIAIVIIVFAILLH